MSSKKDKEKVKSSEEKEAKKSSSSSADSVEEKAAKSSSSDEPETKGSSDEPEPKSSDSDDKGKSSDDKEEAKKSSSSSSSSSSSGSSSSSSDDHGKAELVKIDTEKYKPRGPSAPIPPGAEDCFGKYNDPDVIECQKCLEAENCAAVMKANLKKEGETVEDKKKEKKSSDEKEKEKKSSKKKSSDDKKKSSDDKKEKEKKKGPVSDALQAILDESKFEKRDGKLKAGRVKAYIFVGKAKALKLTKIKDEEKFKVFLKTKLEPEAFDLKSKYFKRKDKDTLEYKGDNGKLGGYLETYFKNFEKANEKAKEDKKKS